MVKSGWSERASFLRIPSPPFLPRRNRSGGGLAAPQRSGGGGREGQGEEALTFAIPTSNHRFFLICSYPFALFAGIGFNALKIRPNPPNNNTSIISVLNSVVGWK